MDKVKVVHAGEQIKTIYGAGDTYGFLATGEETNGKYFLAHAYVPPGEGPPPHIQTREEEGFYVLEGELVFRAGGQKVVAKKGTFLHVPRNVPHHFKNESSEPASMLMFFAPAGIEVMMDIMAANPEKYEQIGKEYGVEFVESAGPE